MSDIGTNDLPQNNASNAVGNYANTSVPGYVPQADHDKQEPSEGMRPIEHDEPLQHPPQVNMEQSRFSGSLESTQSGSINTDPPSYGTEEHLNPSGSVDSMTQPKTAKEFEVRLPQSNEQKHLSTSMESTQSGTVIINRSNEDIETRQQNIGTAADTEQGSGWVSVLKYVWPKGTRRRLQKLSFVGKFEAFLGIYFILFGVASVIVSFQVYKQYFIAVSGCVAGFGVLLLLAGSSKLCVSPSEGNTKCNAVFSMICFFGAGGVSVYCIFNILNPPAKYAARWDQPYMITVSAGVTAATALLCLLHVGCYCTGKSTPLERAQVIVHTNTRTGEKFFEPVRPQPQVMDRERVGSIRDDVSELPYSGSSQDMVQYVHQQNIPMSNIGRSTSMRTIQNQYVERPNHELPQYHTVHRHPITMQQHRQQEMRYAQSEFNSREPAQISYIPYDQSEFMNKSAMAEMDRQQKTPMRSPTYAKSDYGHPRAMTEVDYPQPRTLPNRQYAQSEVGQPRAVAEVDYPPRAMPSQHYAHSEFGQSQAMTEVDYPQPVRTSGPPYARSEVGLPMAPREMDYPPNMPTPSRQYVPSDISHPATVSRYPQHTSEINYPASVARSIHAVPVVQEVAYHPTMSDYEMQMQRPMHPHAEMGFRTVPAPQARYQGQAPPSEAGYSYAPSEAGYPPSQSGRISPRMALAARQMQMDAARHESIQRQQFVRDSSQQYMVATRPYR